MSETLENERTSNWPPSVCGSIPRVQAPDVARFRREYAAQNRPVIITGAMLEWKALERWDLPYLRVALGTTPLRVYTSENGAFRAHPQRGFHPSLWRDLTAEQYINWIDSGTRSPHLLLQNQSLLTKFPQLIPDIGVPAYVELPRVRDVNFWLGGGDNVTPLHCDQADNLLAQVVGKKRILLAAPGQRRNVYPFSPFNRIPPVTSRVNLDAPDLRRFPRSANIEFLAATLRPGEMLFLPVHWWHEVRGVGINVSVNFWWEASLRNLWRHPSYMLNIYVYNFVRAAHNWLRPFRTIKLVS